MSPEPNGHDNHQQPPQPPSSPPSQSEDEGSDLLPQPMASFSIPYNQNHENSLPLSSVPTMFMTSMFPDTLYDHELETQFCRLNISSNNNPTHHHQSLYGNNMVNNGRAGSVLGNNNNNDFEHYYLRFLQYTNKNELQGMRVQSAVNGQMGAYMQQQHQQGFFDVSENWMSFPTRTTSNFGSIVTNSQNSMPRNGLQNPYEYFGGVPGQYNNVYQRLNINGDIITNNRYLLPSMAKENDMVLSRQPMSFLGLESLRGSIFAVAKDQFGYKFLQNKVERGKPEEIEMIFHEIIPHVHDLMVDQFGNFIMQKLFEVCNFQQMNLLLVILVRDWHQLLTICVDTYGTRAIQKLLDYLTTEEQRTFIVSALQYITLDLCKNGNGHHVIRHCLKIFRVRENMPLLDVVILHCIDIATDRSGCCVIQLCLEHAQAKHRERLFEEITRNSLSLSENRYGNYVVQYLLELGIQHITNEVLAHLKSNFIYLSMNKFGSNVVEKCFKEADRVQCDKIILEIITHNKFLMFLQDSYGNYVAQSALKKAQGPIRDQMIRQIQSHCTYLQSHPHGRRVLARARDMSKQRPS